MANNKVQPYQLGTYHMANVHEFEPQRTNNFEVQIVGLPNTNGRTITLAVASYTAPQIEQQVIEVDYGNNKIKFAGKPTFNNSPITLNDFIGQDVEKIISDWQKLAYDYSTQKIGWAYNRDVAGNVFTDEQGNQVYGGYKKTAYLIEYAPDGSCARTWMLVGCWIQSLSLGNYSQEGNAVRQIECTLVYDYAIPDTEATTYVSDSTGGANSMSAYGIPLRNAFDTRR